jgi:hypothetical protein
MPSTSPSSHETPPAPGSSPRPEEIERTSVAAEGSDGESLWVTRQVEAIAAAWQRGESVSAEDILARHPGLGTEAAVRLIYEEVCLRRDAGQEVPTTEVVARFPHWRSCSGATACSGPPRSSPSFPRWTRCSARSA